MRKKRTLHIIKEFLMFVTVATLVWFGLQASAQTSVPQTSAPQNSARNDQDTTRAQLARFDRFLDSHPEVAEQLRKDPSLVKNEEFRKNHPALQEFLQQHPGVREEFAENPNAFMRQEQRFDRREDGRDHDPSVRDLANFGQFLSGHSGMAQQLSKNPSLANNQKFIDSHPELQQYLTAHPGVKDRLTQNPQAVMTGIQPPNNNPTKTLNPSMKPTPMQKQ